MPSPVLPTRSPPLSPPPAVSMKSSKLPLEIDNPKAPVLMPRSTGKVEFQNVSFSYKPKEPLLHDVSFAANPGQIMLPSRGATGRRQIHSPLPHPPLLRSHRRGASSLTATTSATVALDDLRRAVGLVFPGILPLLPIPLPPTLASAHPTPPASKSNAPPKSPRPMTSSWNSPTVMKPSSANKALPSPAVPTATPRSLLCPPWLVLEPSILILDDATAAIDPDTEHVKSWPRWRVP